MTTWVPITGYEGYYEVSDDGQVRGVDRVDCVGQRRAGKILSQASKVKKAGDKPLMKFVSLCKDRSRVNGYVHHLVAAAFLGPRPPGMYVCHKDGDATNNHVDNLYYGTPKQNGEDASRHGTTLRGKRNQKTKLSEHQVSFIQLSDLSARGAKSALAKQLGVAATTISAVLHKRNWRWLRA
jgi:hypothetical protein